MTNNVKIFLTICEHSQVRTIIRKYVTESCNYSMIKGWYNVLWVRLLEVNMHYHISKVELKQQAALPTTWDKGYRVFLDKRVGILSGWSTQFIHTTVMGTKTYEVTLEFNIDGELESWKCTCPAAQSYDGLCKHTIATFLKMYEKQEKELQKEAGQNLGWPYNDPTLYDGQFPVSKDENSGDFTDDDKVNQILKLFKHTFDDVEKKPVKVEFQLEFGNQAYLYGYSVAVSLRIGLDRLYIVKDIKNFLRCLADEDKEFYSKNFEFNAKLHTFPENCKQIINMLSDIYEDERVRENNRFISNKTSNVFDRKYVLLTSKKFKQFIEMIPKEYLTISDGNTAYPANIIDGSPKLDFYVDDFEDQICIRMKEDFHFEAPHEGYEILYDGKDTLYKPQKSDLGSLQRVDELFHVEKEIFLPITRVADLANSVFPVLKRVGKLHISDVLSERMVERNLEKRLYLDYDKNGIHLKVQFAYGDSIFDPAEERGSQSTRLDKTQSIILRDIAEESVFLNVFRARVFDESKTGYTVSGDHFEYLFLSEYAPTLMAQAVVYATDSYRDKRVINEAKIHQSVRLGGEDYLEYNFEIDGISDQDLKSVLKAYRQKKTYYKLKNGGFIDLNNDGFEMLSQLMGTFDIKSKDIGQTIKLPASSAYYVDFHLEKAGGAHVSRNDAFKQLIAKLHTPESMDIKVPSSLDDILREYQITGYQWLQTLANCKMGGILADDMGLGKTLQILTFLLSQKESGVTNPALIVAPTSLVYNWAAEIEKFTPGLSYEIVHGSKQERTDRLSGDHTSDIYITSYATLRRDMELYEEVQFGSVILDEAQHIKNEASKAAQSAKNLMATHRFALTGTPMENHLGEFWSIFDFILPGHLGSKYSFTNTFEKPIVKEGDEDRGAALRAMIKPFLLRRLKSDVLPELPDKIQSQVIVEMTEEQKKVYAATVSRIRNEIDEQIKTSGVAKSQLQILAALTRLRQICSHPSVYLEDYEGSSGKFEALRELLQELKDSGHRPLIFSQFTSVLSLIKTLVEEMGLNYHYLDGSTKAKSRGEMVDRFNEGEGDLFLISLKAGGSGLNLTGADTVIHFDPWWNPAVEDQASDRAYRIGQTKTVHVMKLVTRGSIEEKIIKLQDRKRKLIDKIIKPGETLITSLSEDEIKGLFDII